MKLYTIVKDGQLGAIHHCPDDLPPTNLDVGETCIEGAYPAHMFKLVNGVVTDLSQAEFTELSLASSQTKISPKLFVDRLVSKLTEAGTSVSSSLPPPVEWTKADAKSAIDQSAGRARFRMASAGVFVDEEYTQTELAVQQWRLDGSPANDVPDEVACWAEAQTPPWTNEAAAQDIEYNALGFKYMIALIRRHRLTGKGAVDAAQIDFASVAQPFINYLNGI
jgi:hypothetical protein